MEKMFKVLAKHNAEMIVQNLGNDAWNIMIRYGVMGGMGTASFTFKPKEGFFGDTSELSNVPELIDKELTKHIRNIRTETTEDFMEKEGLK